MVYHQIVKTEKDIYYKKALNHLRAKGYIIQSITCDGRRGLLKTMIKTLKTSSRNEFYLKIYKWKIKHQHFLNERLDKPNEKGKYPYKRRNVRSALASINRYLD